MARPNDGGLTLQASQLAGLTGDINLDSLNLALMGMASEGIIDMVTDVELERTIDGASTLTVTVQDASRRLIHSKFLGAGVDTEIDGLWFRLAAVNWDGDTFNLVFEDREVAVLRQYDHPKTAAWGTKTRAQFVRDLIQEVKEFQIPVVIPGSHLEELIDPNDVTAWDGSTVPDNPVSPPFNTRVYVKTYLADQTQREMIGRILKVGYSMTKGMPNQRKLLVCSIMTATVESECRNLPDGDLDSAGLFQQRPSQGWGTYNQVTNPEYASRKFFEHAIAEDKFYKGYGELCQDVQVSAFPERYDFWRQEAERTVTIYGIPEGDTPEDQAANNSQTGPDPKIFQLAQNNNMQFTRGIFSQDDAGKQKVKKENTWECAGRLADEVQMRRFMNAGVFYFVEEKWLFDKKPSMIIEGEFTGGMLGLGGRYDVGQRNAEITLEVLLDRWTAPPGSVIKLQNMGIIDGKWITNNIRRSMFSPMATVSLKKPRPRLPEPRQKKGGGGYYTPGDAPPVIPPPTPTNEKLVQPLYEEDWIRTIGIHTTDGLGGTNNAFDGIYWPTQDADDFCARAGSLVLACEEGEIAHWSGHDPNEGPQDGVHGPFGWSIYVRGKSGTMYYHTHLGSRHAGVGAKVSAGTVIGTVGDYAKWGGTDHCHLGVRPKKVSDLISLYHIGDVLAAPKLSRA